MSHIHSVYDTDTHFKIDATTRVVKNTPETKVMIVQHDHNSERFTFEIPRYVDGHDMSSCNVVQVHYINTDATGKGVYNKGIYEVDDLQISPDDDNVVICSWLISGNATQHVGKLSFIIRFACTTGGVVDYAWNTATHSNVHISSGINNGNEIAEEYVDVLEQWREELFSKIIAEGTGEMVKLELVEGSKITVSGETTETAKLYHAGKNLAPAYTGDDVSQNGTTITKEVNGKVTVYGTPTASVYANIYRKDDPFYLPAGTYTLLPYGFPDAIAGASTGLTYTLQSIDSTITKTVSTSTGVARFTLETGTYFSVTVTVMTKYDGESRTIGVMLLDKDVTADDLRNYEYEPYCGDRISTALPVSVDALEGTNILYSDGGHTITAVVKENVNSLVTEAIKKLSFNYTDYGLPVLYLNGNTTTMTKDNAVDLSYVYGNLRGKASVKWQGSSSLKYPKKNYTVKFDQEFEAVEGWGAQKKYCMKANFIDFSHARNLCCAKLWGQIVASRNPANEALAACPNYGAVDGFPICMVINGEYQGVYTFNIPKDGWMLNMGSGTQEAILCADLNSPANNFKAEAVVGGDKTDFELEYTTDEDNADWVQTSLNNLIRACINSDGSDLDTTIAAMLDWDSVIDYYIFSALIDHRDGIGKNYLLHTYDGTKWAYDAYDMDSVFGLHWDGDLDAARFLTSQAGMSFGYLKNAHRLVGLIVSYKKDKLKSRYTTLRNGVLSEDNVQMVLRNFAGKIPHQLLEEDNRKWPTIPNTNANTVQQAIDWYRLRVAKIDAEINAM